MAEDSEKPIIIKRINVAGHGHHGGAWKVAYADFVTAMMAFFLLLWLLSTTSEGQKDAIADYFTPTVGVKDSEGIGFKGGEIPVDEGIRKSDLMPIGIIQGAPPVGELAKDPVQVEREYQEDTEELEKTKAELEKMLQNQLGEFEQNLLIDMTPEGLRIQLIDQDKRPMFQPGSANLADYAKKILSLLKPILVQIPNKMSVTGHTDSSKYGIAKTYGNWELSSDRALTTRRYLRENGLPEDKIVVVLGKADTEHLIPQDPANPMNRRISMVLLRKSIYPYEVPVTEDLMKAPKATDTYDFTLPPAAPKERPYAAP